MKEFIGVFRDAADGSHSFKRTEESQWETGIALGEDGLIVDLEGNAQLELYDYIAQPNKGSLLIRKE